MSVAFPQIAPIYLILFGDCSLYKCQPVQLPVTLLFSCRPVSDLRHPASSPVYRFTVCKDGWWVCGSWGEDLINRWLWHHTWPRVWVWDKFQGRCEKSTNQKEQVSCSTHHIYMCEISLIHNIQHVTIINKPRIASRSHELFYLGLWCDPVNIPLWLALRFIWNWYLMSVKWQIGTKPWIESCGVSDYKPRIIR